MAKFEVGEVAIQVLGEVGPLDDPKDYKNDGGEVEIVMVGTNSGLAQADGEQSYEILCADGEIYVIAESCLRKKKPPEESRDITETRQKGAPSFTQLMQDLKREEMVK